MKLLIVLCSLAAAVHCGVMTGGQMPIEHGLTEPSVQFAIYAINQNFQNSGDNAERTGVKVISATSQVVQGAMFRYKIEVQGGDQNEVCDISVWSRPWLSEAESMLIQSGPECHPVALSKRGMSAYKTNLNDKFVKFAVKGINEAYASIGDKTVRKPVKLLVSQKQGTQYFFEIEVSTHEVCTISLSSSPKLKVTAGPKCKPMSNGAPPAADDAPLALSGGLSAFHADVNDPMVTFAVNGINAAYASIGDNTVRSPVRLLVSQKQVVQGTKYIFTIEVSGAGKHEACTISTWNRPWLSGSEQLKVIGGPKCKPM